MRPLRALIVEDDENDFLLIGHVLQEYGFALQIARVDDEPQLRASLESGEWDVVLSDYRLPSFSGRRALEIVRTLRGDLPFILVTAALGDELAVEMMREGADDYVLKDRLARLGHSVDRSVRDYEHRRERTRAHEDLALAQRRFQQTFEHAPIGIVHIDVDGRFLSVNDQYCAMTGYSRGELLEMTFSDFTHHEDRDAGLRGFAELKTGVRPIHRSVKRYLRRDGAVIWVDLIATVVYTPDGAVDYTLGMMQEITARKEAEEKVRRQGMLLDAVEQAVIATDMIGNITYWSRFAAKLYGRSEQEVLGRHVLDVITPLISNSVASEILNRLVTGESWTGELTVIRGDGSELPVMVIQSPTVDADGTVSGMVAVSFDLSERKAAEAALRRSEERYRSVIEGVVEIIISVAPDGLISSVNRAFVIATGWTPEEVVGCRTVWDLMPPEQVPTARERLAQRLAGSDLPPVSGLLLCKDGSVLIIDGVACVTRTDEGRPEVFYFIRDITARTRAEEARMRLDRQLRLVLESTDEGIYAVDAAGNCTLLNRAAAQILGYSPEELIGRTVHDVIHGSRPDGTPYPKDDCPVFHALRLGTTARVANEVYWRRDGTAIPVEYASAPVIENGAIIGAVTTFQDVSQRRMLESQLERANRLNGLGRVAATIAHEFNNILMGIQPFVDILRLDAAKPRTLDAIERIATSVRRGKRVTSEILQFTRQSEPHRRPLSVAAWLDGLAAEARQVAGHQIELNVHGDLDLTVSADGPALHQVFMNLIVNARDAMSGRGEITINARRCEGSLFPFGVVEHGDTFAHFSVADTGVGITPETMQHVFEPLFTTKKSGTGLGLALAHHVVRQHKGHIFVESQPPAGTTFHIFLPLAEQAAARETEKRPAARPERLRSVVLVEDDPAVAAGLATLLALDEVTVEVAVNGRDALPTIERASPDAVVLDVGLPDIDGTLVYEAIERRWPTLPVIFATGHVDASRLSAYTAKANVGHIMKPYELSALYESLAELTPN
jgi:PAS domain S-box-containing protein